jgi:sensor histidine kinase YesM
LVENAVKHGVGRSIDGGQIDVEAFVDEDLLVLQVRDTGAGLQAKTSETLAKPATGGVGLANIRERIQSLYGDEASLTLSANQPRGAVSTLSIPIAKLKKSI